MDEEVEEKSKKFLIYMGSHGFIRAGGSIDGASGSLSLAIRESKRGEKTRDHEIQTIRVHFGYMNGVTMTIKDCLETPVRSLQAMERGTNLLHRVHDWAREHGTILREKKDEEGMYESIYRIK